MIILPANTLSGGYEVANSCRFDDGDSAYMHKTPGGAGNVDTWTFSAWVKLGNIGTEKGLLHAESDSNNYTAIRFSSDHKFKVLSARAGSTGGGFYLITTRLFRDPSAWYHIVVAVNTTLASATLRVRIYVNGVEETAFDTDTFGASQNYDTDINSTSQQNVGDDNSGFFDGYLAEVCLIDGQQLTPTSFGEFSEDSPNIWMPKDVSGLTFGTNGFYLDFKDSSNLGNDANGGTDLTEVNLAAIDQASDSPTNNFCVINPLASNVTLSEGNLQFSGITNCKSSMAMQNGKWYAECKITNDNTYNPQIGIGQTGTEHMDNPLGDGYAGNTADSYHYERTGEINANGSDDAQTGLTTIAQNDIVGVAVDLDSGTKTCKWYINNTLRGTQNLSETGSNPYLFWTYASGSQAGEGQWNFGGCQSFTISSAQTDENGYGAFEYAPPSGYYALCTKNLAEFG